MINASILPLRLVQLMILMFIGSVGATVYLYIGTQSFLADGVSTQGIVVGHNVYNDSDGTDYTVRIGYHDLTGHSYTTDSSFHAATPQYAIGDALKVVYNPKNPSEATVLSFWDLYLWPFIFGVLAVSSLISSLVLYFLIYKKSLVNSSAGF